MEVEINVGKTWIVTKNVFSVEPESRNDYFQQEQKTDSMDGYYNPVLSSLEIQTCGRVLEQSTV